MTFKNKILAAYLGSLALARLAVSLATSFVKPPTIVSLPPLPVDAFNLCGIVVHLQFKMVPNSIDERAGRCGNLSRSSSRKASIVS